MSEAHAVSLRGRLHQLIYSSPVQGFIIVCIVVNAIQLGFDTWPTWYSFAGKFSRTLDAVFIGIFAVEVACKILADGVRFFKSGWNVFDFLVVSISLIPGEGSFRFCAVSVFSGRSVCCTGCPGCGSSRNRC